MSSTPQIDIKNIKRYKKKSIAKLIKIAQNECNKYIRLRDEGKKCISCQEYKVLQAGHFYSAGHFSNMRFNENNIHGQCKRCNYFLSGNLGNYRLNIVERIGEQGLKELDDLAGIYRRCGHKWDRFTLIDIILYYKQKIKEL